MIDLRSLRAAARALAPTTPEKALLAAASGALVVAGARRAKRAEQIVKPFVMSSIAAGLWRTRHRRDAIDNLLLGTATAASLAGDVLMIEEEFAEPGADADTWIKRGAAAFAVGHVATISLALRHGARPGVTELLPRVGGLIWGIGLLAARRREVFLPLAAYSKLLALMSSTMASPQLIDGATDKDPRRALDLGGVLFLLSDATLVHRQVFLDKDSAPGSVAEGWVLASYTAAQAMLFDGLATVAASRGG